MPQFLNNVSFGSGAVLVSPSLAGSPPVNDSSPLVANTSWVTNYVTTRGYAADSAVVHLAGTETITGAKTYSAATTHNDGANIVVGTTTGTKIGTATTQKLSFYNATPIVQPTGDIVAALANLGLVSSPTIANGYVKLAANFNITAANATFQDTGLAISLPAAGTYLILSNVRVALQGNSDAMICIQLYETDTNAVVPDSTRLVFYTTVINQQFQAHASFSFITTVTSACSIKLYAKRDGFTSTWTASIIVSGVDGYTSISYLKLTS